VATQLVTQAALLNKDSYISLTDIGLTYSHLWHNGTS